MSNPLDYAEDAAPALTYGGGTGAFFFGLDYNAIGVVAGIMIGVCGLLLSWYFQRRRDIREQEEHDRRMRGDKP